MFKRNKKTTTEIVATPASTELVHPASEGFREKVTPKAPDEKLFLFKCNHCGGIHFRHAGYASVMLPFLETGGAKKIALEEHRVMVCVSCKHSWMWANGQCYDLSDKVDLKAWERTEKEAHKATGPGGQC